MTCSLTDQLTAQLLEGLEPKAKLKAHIQSCADCRQVYRKIKALKNLAHLNTPKISLSPDFKRQVIAAARGDKVAGRIRPTLRWILAAAAILLAFGLWHTFHANPDLPEKAPEISSLHRPEVPKNIPVIRVLDVVSWGEHSEGLLQDMLRLETYFAKPGDKIAGYELVAIDGVRVTLKEEDGILTTIDPDSNREEWQAFMMKMQGFYRECIAQRDLRGEDFEILLRMADVDEKGMLALVQTIAQSDWQAYASKARRALSGGRGSVSHVHQLLKKAQSKDLTKRMIALSALGSIKSPLARNFLRAQLENPQDPLIHLVVDGLLKQEDLLAVKRLEELHASGRLPPAVARNISQRLDTLIGGRDAAE
ncbi:hypothetical protein ACFL54_03960 [Planctomycetota bacterium]